MPEIGVATFGEKKTSSYIELMFEDYVRFYNNVTTLASLAPSFASEVTSGDAQTPKK